MVIADGFALLSSLREVHLLLAEGAHNQFGDLPWTSRAEMLMMQWLLGRPEMREFLRGRAMVPYSERWMGQVDTMKKLQGWTDTSITHFRSLAVYGEQILLSIRYGNWNDVIDQDNAKIWARSWRPEVQGYIHAYQAATGVDLSEDIVDWRGAPARSRRQSIEAGKGQLCGTLRCTTASSQSTPKRVIREGANPARCYQAVTTAPWAAMRGCEFGKGGRAMKEEFEFENFDEHPFLGEFEDEIPRPRAYTQRHAAPRRSPASRRVPSRRAPLARPPARPYGKLPTRPRPRPGTRVPIRFPARGGFLGLDVGLDHAPAYVGFDTAQPVACEPCLCPSCANQSDVNQPPMDQRADQPDANLANADQDRGDQTDVDQAPEGDELMEFFYPQNEFSFGSEFENWQGEVNQSDPRIIDLTARADKSRRLLTRDPKKVWALVLHQMACCFKVKDPLTRFLKMAPHFAILPDGRILQLHPILSLTGASNGFNAGSVAVEFAGNFPDTRGRWWHGEENGRDRVTPAQIEAARYLVRYLIRTMGLREILAGVTR